MRCAHFLYPLIALTMSACAQAQPQNEEDIEGVPVSDDEIFKAAGFKLTRGSWGKCGDPGTMSYEPGAIRERGDFNGDGRFDALLTEGGTYCFGMTGMGYTLVTRSQDGSWIIMDERIGMPEFLKTKGTAGWPDIQVGGPGFCFPVLRWNGNEYVANRTEYEGAACRM